jgi:hypothetical protein
LLLRDEQKSPIVGLELGDGKDNLLFVYSESCSLSYPLSYKISKIAISGIEKIAKEVIKLTNPLRGVFRGDGSSLEHSQLEILDYVNDPERTKQVIKDLTMLSDCEKQLETLNSESKRYETRVVVRDEDVSNKLRKPTEPNLTTNPTPTSAGSRRSTTESRKPTDTSRKRLNGDSSRTNGNGRH